MKPWASASRNLTESIDAQLLFHELGAFVPRNWESCHAARSSKDVSPQKLRIIYIMLNKGKQ